MKFISLVTPCFNEEENIENLYNQVKDVMNSLEGYSYEHIFIDNASKDKTVEILKSIAEKDKNVKIIVNTRNFGYIRSAHHALLKTGGDAVISIVADLQDPPSMIVDFVKKWEEGYKVVVAVKKNSQEPVLMFLIRRLYYHIIGNLSEVELIKNATGFGLYDKKVVDIIKEIDDPYPYFRGLICDIGFERAEIPYTQPRRNRGITKNNFYSLYDTAMLGITNHSKIPLRLASFSGFILSIIFFCIGMAYLIYKLIFWQNFQVGMAPVMIGLFFFASIQLFFIGILGEYIGSIHTQVLKRPLVIEKETINLD